MKVTIELPDTAMCAFVNYVFYDINTGMSMGAKSIDTDDLKRGYVAAESIEKGGAEE